VLFNKKASKNVAKERLQLILIHDRIQLSPRELEEMKKEILAVVSKYVEVSEQELMVSLQRNDEDMALHADIPIKNKRGS
jgi:cell division topological specificity factor